MDRKYCLAIGLLLVLVWVFSAADKAAAKVYIDIDAPGFQQFPVAVCDFQIKKAETDDPSQKSVDLSDSVRRYLDLTGIFRVLDKKSFLEGIEPGSPEVIRFSDWSAIGADFLLRGNLRDGGNGLSAESRLYDVTRGQVIFEKKYSAPDGSPQTLGLSIASDILLALTGDAGDFRTRIAFVIKKKSGSDIFTMNYDASDLKNMTNDHSIVAAPRWSPDGRYFAFTSYKNGRPMVFLRHLKTGKEKTIASFSGLNLCGSFSPDGRKILLTLSKDGNEEIYALDIETMHLNRLTNSFSIDVSPAWSPDGRKIAFVSNRSGSPQIFVMDADGSNVKRVTFEGNYNTSPSWSPRGGRIAYEGLINRKYQIFSADEEGNNLIQLTFDEADNEYPSWSPSGRQIVFHSRQNGKSRICIMNANGMNLRVLKESRDLLVMPAWSPRPGKQ